MKKPETSSPPNAAADGLPLKRRDVLKVGGAFVASFGAFGCQGGRVNVAAGAQPGNAVDRKDLYLSEVEEQTLEALTDVFIPADIDAGAVEAQCARAINLLLSAFAFDPPMIFAGGPFSDRGGAEQNDFEQFIPLDTYEATAWRLKIQGSRGLPELEFNGPVLGWQQIYREGLAALDQAASSYGFSRFADMPAVTRELLLRAGGNDTIDALVDVAFVHCLDAMYGAPEYGGNRDLVGWDFTGYMGDVQPRGFTREEVENPDNPGLLDLLPIKRFQARQSNISEAALLPVPDVDELRQIQHAIRDLVLLHSDELSLGMVLDAQGSWQRLRRRVAELSPGDHA